MKILIIAAHPDDEVLGVGGTVCKHVAQNDEVYVCIVTKANEPEWTAEYIETKKKEQRKVDKLLKIKKRINLNLLTTCLNTIPHGKLNKMIYEVVNEINPNIVYTHFENDLNHDHTLVFRASMVATRPPRRIKLLCFETLSETEWNNKTFQPNIWVDIKGYMNTKIKAFKIYRTEVKAYPHPRSEEGIRVLSKKRGSEACFEYAESFMLVRDYIK